MRMIIYMIVIPLLVAAGKAWDLPDNSLTSTQELTNVVSPAAARVLVRSFFIGLAAFLIVYDQLMMRRSRRQEVQIEHLTADNDLLRQSLQNKPVSHDQTGVYSFSELMKKSHEP